MSFSLRTSARSLRSSVPNDHYRTKVVVAHANMEKNESQTTELPTFNTPTRDPDFEVYWKPDDPENPVNWSIWYRGFIVGVVSFSTTCVYVYQIAHLLLLLSCLSPSFELLLPSQLTRVEIL